MPEKAYVDQKVASLVDSAPAQLDTLKELSNALNNDANFGATVTKAISEKLPVAGGEISGNLEVKGTINGVSISKSLFDELASHSKEGRPRIIESILDGCYTTDGATKYTKVTQPGTGLDGYETGDIHLTKSYKEYDEVLIVLAPDDLTWSTQSRWKTWELEYYFNHAYTINLAKNFNFNWWVWSAKKIGTTDHPLSDDKIWKLSGEHTKVVDILGVKY